MSHALRDRVTRAIAGDNGALAELLQEHGPAVERRLRIDRTWRAQLDPADVMQVTYLEAFLQIGRFDPARADSFAAWLTQIAENNLRDAIRGLQRQKQPPPDRRRPAGNGDTTLSADLDTLLESTSTPSRKAGRKEAVTLLEKALARLPADYAAALRLYDLEERAITDVAAALDRTAGAVHMLRARALDRLRELLSGRPEILSHGR